MGGSWSPPPNQPIRPGAYVNFESSGAAPIEPGTFGRVAMPIRATWGPENTFVEIITDADRTATFGKVDNYDKKNSALVGTPTNNTSWLIAEAIRGGSELVKAYRMVGANAAQAKVVLDDWLDANTLVLTAKYKGTRANGFTIKVAASPIFTGKNVLSILEGGEEIEQWRYNPDDLAALASDINSSTKGSKFVVASFASGAGTQRSEVVKLKTITGTLTSGKFRLEIKTGVGSGTTATTYTTADIAYDANIAAIQTAVDTALAGAVVGYNNNGTSITYAAGDLVVAGSAGNMTALNSVLTLTAEDTLANQNISVAKIGPVDPANALVGGDIQLQQDTWTLTQDGTGLSAGQVQIGIDFGDGSVKKTADIAYNAVPATVQAAVNALLVDNGYEAGEVVVSLSGLTIGAASNVTTLKVASSSLLTIAAVSIHSGTTPQTGVLPAVAAGAENALQSGARSPLKYGEFAMSGGSDGAAIALSDYSSALQAFQAAGGFDLLALDGVSEEDFVGLNAAVAEWAIINNDAGRYVMAVVGGGNTELANAGGTGVGTALARTALFDSEWVVNIGVSGLNVTAPCGTTLPLSSAQCAPRLAGQIAAAGITGSITFNQVTGVDSVNGALTPSQVEEMIKQGVVVFAKRGSAVRIEDGVTTFTSVTDEKDFTFTQIRAVRAIQQIGININDIVEGDWIGKKINTTTVRDSLVARLQQYFAVLEARNVLVNGTKVSIDTRYDNTKTDVFVLVEAQFQFELKRVLLTVRVPTVS